MAEVRAMKRPWRRALIAPNGTDYLVCIYASTTSSPPHTKNKSPTWLRETLGLHPAVRIYDDHAENTELLSAAKGSMPTAEPFPLCVSPSPSLSKHTQTSN